MPELAPVAEIIYNVAKRVAQKIGSPRRAALIAVSGPQGSGKTTAACAAVNALVASGLKAVTVSLDDYYLPYTELAKVAECQNPLLNGRGNPGTHDLSALYRDLSLLQSRKPVAIARFDKSLNNGKGDRISPEPAVEGGYDVVVLEGWCVGLLPPSTNSLAKLSFGEPWAAGVTSDDICQVMLKLADYNPVWELCDETILIRAKSLDYVYDWRLQQESDLRSLRGTGLSDDQVCAMVNRFMPVYHLADYPTSATATVITLDRTRHIT